MAQIESLTHLEDVGREVGEYEGWAKTNSFFGGVVVSVLQCDVILNMFRL